MIATVGQIVHYTPAGDEGVYYAAIVTSIASDGYVSLEMFYPPRAHHLPADALESVAEHSGAGPRGGTWHFPEHVPGARPPRY